MKIEYDNQADALYISFQEGAHSESKEVEKGVIVDYNENGEILGIEIIRASKLLNGKGLDEVIVSLPRVEA